jgi:hypothetical protein
MDYMGLFSLRKFIKLNAYNICIFLNIYFSKKQKYLIHPFEILSHRKNGQSEGFAIVLVVKGDCLEILSPGSAWPVNICRSHISGI